MCIDFRLLHSIFITDAYSMKHAHEFLYQIGEAQVINLFELTKVFWSTPKSEYCSQYIAFVYPFAQFQWRIMPLGMKNAVRTFQNIWKNIDIT